MGARGPKPGNRPKARSGRLHLNVKPEVRRAIFESVDPSNEELDSAGKVVENFTRQCVDVKEEKKG